MYGSTFSCFVLSFGTEDVMFRGDIAFNINPASGEISGTPSVELPQNAGRAILNITCILAKRKNGQSRIQVMVVACCCCTILSTC